MKTTITKKIKLNINAQQKELLLRTMQAYVDSCNYASAYVFLSKERKQAKVQEKIYRELRDRHGISAQGACNAIRDVIAKYKARKECKKEIKFTHQYCKLSWNRDYTLKENNFAMTTTNGREKFECSTEHMKECFGETYTFGGVTVCCKGKNIYAMVTVAKEVEDVKDENICNVVGIDRGINFIVATYDSKGKTTFVKGRGIKQKRAKYVKVRKSLQERNTKSSKRRLKKIGNRENRWMRDVNHCVSKALVKNNPKNTLFVLEDLTGIRKTTEKVRLKNRYVQVSWAFYDLEQKLMYKAQLNQQKVIKVNPKYTSQCCPKCGHIEKANRNKKLHKFACKNCGYRSNDDRIGAMNLYRLGIEYLTNGYSCGEAVLDRKGCNQPSHDATPHGFLRGTKGRRRKPIARLGSCKLGNLLPSS